MFVRNSFKLEFWDQLRTKKSILWSKINLATSQLRPVLSNKLNPTIMTLIAPDHPIHFGTFLIHGVHYFVQYKKKKSLFTVLFGRIEKHNFYLG